MKSSMSADELGRFCFREYDELEVMTALAAPREPDLPAACHPTADQVRQELLAREAKDDEARQRRAPLLKALRAHLSS